MKILPFVSSGEPFLDSAGEVHVVPMQVFSDAGGTVIRIGDNVWFFDRDGHYKGYEATGHKAKDPDLLARVVHETIANQGKAPGEAYYPEGTKGWKSETAGWPKGSPEPLHGGPQRVYTVALKKPPSN